MSDSVKRFSHVVENYIRHRPRYPQQIADFLAEECGLKTGDTLADIGSGTGFLTEVFLKHGNRVYGVEPNNEMRQAAEHYLKAYPNFISLNATAEETSLDKHSVHFVTAGQAFHWFKHEIAHEEFLRILVPKGWVVLVWNNPRFESTPFMAAFSNLWDKYMKTSRSGDNELPDYVKKFFGEEKHKQKTLDNYQDCDFEGLKGRVLSSSYAPRETDEVYPSLLEELKWLFEQYEEQGKVRIEYETDIVYGRLD